MDRQSIPRALIKPALPATNRPSFDQSSPPDPLTDLVLVLVLVLVPFGSLTAAAPNLKRLGVKSIESTFRRRLSFGLAECSRSTTCVSCVCACACAGTTPTSQSKFTAKQSRFVRADALQGKKEKREWRAALS